MNALCIQGAGVTPLSPDPFTSNSQYVLHGALPVQVLERDPPMPSLKKFRLGGLVVEGSVKHSPTSLAISFQVTDLENEMLVLCLCYVPVSCPQKCFGGWSR